METVREFWCNNFDQAHAENGSNGLAPILQQKQCGANERHNNLVMTASFLKAGVFLILVVLIAPTSPPWINWNDAVIVYGSPYSGTPSLPTYSGMTITRVAGYGTSRKLQYAYLLTAGAYSCKVFCGPRTFLTVISGNLYCWRDSDQNYYANLTNNGTAYQSHCVPSAENTAACTAVLSGTNLQAQDCDQTTFVGAYAVNSGKDCCYNNGNHGTLHAVLTDETDITAGNNRKELRDAE